jgi:hypothetical protein
MMRFLRFVSSVALVAALSACGHSYRSLRKADISASGAWGKPEFKRALFRCSVNGHFLWKRFHLSGLLLFKKLGDTTRVVFQNEMGFPFFDFQWDDKDSFSVISIEERLNRPALIRTLQNDFEMLLRMKLDETKVSWFTSKAGYETWFRYPRNNGYVFYISVNGQYRRIDYGRKSSITTISFPLPTAGLPEDIHISHHKAHFTIDLTALNSGSDE